MNFFMISECGEGAHLLKMVQNEGNDVQIYIKNPGYRSAWDGLLPKAKKIDPPKDAVVIFDFSGSGALADKLKKSGWPVVGGSKFADRLEQDRQFGTDVMVAAGIKVPLTAEFRKFAEIEGFLKDNGVDEDGDERRFVFKPSGKGLPSHLTYVSIDNDDLREYVAYAEKNYGKEIESFILQEFICGVAVSTELWCDGTKFIQPIIHDIEVKGFMDGCHGPATGCSGNLVWAEEGNCRISAHGLALVEEQVVKEGHVGPIDLNAIVNEKGIFGLEWTPRFGYDSTPTYAFLFKDKIGKFFSDIARGQLTTGMPLNEKFAAGVRFTIPPYPLEIDAEDVQKVRPNLGVPLRGLTEENVGSLYMYEVMEEDKKLVHSDGTGVLGVAVGTAARPWDVWDKPYRVLCELKIPELQYRTDLRQVIGDMYDRADYEDGASTTLGTIPELELESNG
jgi:phosphoribosylamine--glycine ligase